MLELSMPRPHPQQTMSDPPSHSQDQCHGHAGTDTVPIGRAEVWHSGHAKGKPPVEMTGSWLMEGKLSFQIDQWESCESAMEASLNAERESPRQALDCRKRSLGSNEKQV